MRLISVFIVAFALVLAAAIYLVVPRLMTRHAPEAQRQPPAQVATRDVLVAAEDLPAGTILEASEVRWQRWPDDAIEADYLVREKGADVAKDAVGHVVLRGIEKDAPITPSRLLKPGTAGFLAAALAPGKFASSIAIGPVPGVSGFVLPGDRVDVLLTEHYGIRLEPPAGASAPQINSRDVTSVLLHDVRVLAIDQVVKDIDSKPKIATTATLEVDLDQAEKLALATSLGSLSLTLLSLAQPSPPALAAGPDIVQDFQVSAFRAYVLRHYYAGDTGPKRAPASPDTSLPLVPHIYHGDVLAGAPGR